MDTKNILPRNHSFDTLSGNKAGKNPVCQIPYMCQVSDRFFREHCVHCFFLSAAGAFLSAKGHSRRNTKPMDTFIAVVRSPMVMDTVEETMLLTPFFSTPSTDRLFFPAQCQETAPISQLPDCFRIHCRSISGKPEYFFYLFRYVYECCPSSGTTTSITITIIQITKQIESTRLTGLASFCAVFFSCFKAFPNRLMFYEFHWNIEDKSDSETNDERKEKSQAEL